MKESIFLFALKNTVFSLLKNNEIMKINISSVSVKLKLKPYIEIQVELILFVLQ